MPLKTGEAKIGGTEEQPKNRASGEPKNECGGSAAAWILGIVPSGERVIEPLDGGVVDVGVRAGAEGTEGPSAPRDKAALRSG